MTSTPSTAVLETKDLHASYRERSVLHDVSLKLQTGESVAIIGPSASGKSTLLRCLSLLHPATAGVIRFHGQLVAQGERLLTDQDQFRRRVGLVHQEWNLWPNKSVLANLIEAPLFVLRQSRPNAVALARDWLRRLDMENVEARFPGQLSGGQKQRVAIARAMMMDPSLVMFDEVTSALDVETTDQLLRLLESLQDGSRTFLFVSHHLHFVQRATVRTYVLSKGTVVEHGPSRQIIEQPQHPETQKLLSAVRAVS